jgi:hypothetical protein
VWLIFTGLIGLLNLSFNGIEIVMGILALAAGILLLLGGASIKARARWGFWALSAWLILQGVFALFNLSFAGSEVLMGVLALVAGSLILLER